MGGGREGKKIMDVILDYVDLSKRVVNSVYQLYSFGLFCKGHSHLAAYVISCIGGRGEFK